MIIVGVTGGIGHGKTTFAEYLGALARSYKHWESSDVIIEVANCLRHESLGHPAPGNIAAINAWLAPLADIITTCVHCPADFTQFAITEERLAEHPENGVKLFEYLAAMRDHPELQKVDITTANKTIFRPLLQWLGGYLAKTVSEGIWYDELIRRIRLEKQQGLELVTVSGVRFPADAERIRNSGGYIAELKRANYAEPDKQDLTERERELIEPDTVVHNDSNLEALQACAQQVYSDLQQHSLQPRYRC